MPRPRRRLFSNADKRRVLAAADRCTRPVEIVVLLRREAVHSPSLSAWRRRRQASDLAALAPQKRGPKVIPVVPMRSRSHSSRDNDKLNSRLDKALL